MSSPIAGELVTETFDYDGGRQVTAYVPPVPPEAVVYAGDGQLISQWGCVLEAAGVRPPAVMPSSLPRAYLVAGTLEPFFLENATRWAVALRDAGADVVMAERAGSHGDAFWRAELPLMVAWALGR
jgi:hypothetical protein